MAGRSGATSSLAGCKAFKQGDFCNLLTGMEAINESVVATFLISFPLSLKLALQKWREFQCSGSAGVIIPCSSSFPECLDRFACQHTVRKAFSLCIGSAAVGATGFSSMIVGLMRPDTWNHSARPYMIAHVVAPLLCPLNFLTIHSTSACFKKRIQMPKTFS